MFDADKGNQQVMTNVDELTDEFAARFAELPSRQQAKMVQQFNKLLDDPDAVSAFQAGDYAQDSSGQQAKALGTGAPAPTPNDLQSALDTIMNAPGASDGQKAAMTRIFFGGANRIAVEDDGTPSELKSTRKERDDAKTAKKAAEDKLTEEQDETKSGSLAEQLKTAKAAKTAPGGKKMIEVDKVVEGLEKLRDDYVDKITAPVGKPKGKTEAVEAINKEVAKVKK